MINFKLTDSELFSEFSKKKNQFRYLIDAAQH